MPRSWKAFVLIAPRYGHRRGCPPAVRGPGPHRQSGHGTRQMGGIAPLSYWRQWKQRAALPIHPFLRALARAAVPAMMAQHHVNQAQLRTQVRDRQAEAGWRGRASARDQQPYPVGPAHGLPRPVEIIHGAPGG